MRATPESQITSETIAIAKEAISKLTDEELNRQLLTLQTLAETAPLELGDVTRELERVRNELQENVLLGALSGTAGIDLQKLNLLEEALVTDRRQRRVDIERNTTVMGLVQDEIRFRAQNSIYRSTMHAMPSIRAELAQDIPQASALLAKVMGSYCLTQSIPPSSIIVEGFVNTVLGDVKKAAEAYIATTKANALEEFRAVDAWAKKIESNAKAKAEGKSKAVPGNTSTEIE